MPISRTSKPAGRLLGGLIAAALAGCGGGGGGSSSGTGSFSLSITDAPVDDAQEVVVTFTAVTIKPAEATAETFTLDTPRSINLLDFTNGTSVTLIDNETVEAGQYDWVRLTIDEDNTYLVDAIGGQHDLFVPSGAQSGLKLNRSFNLAESGDLDLTIDFDLRKSVHMTGAGQYILRPTLRIVSDDAAGTLTGTVDATVITSLLNMTGRGTCYPAVYVFEDEDSIDDLDGDDDPVATTIPDSNDNYRYTVSPLEEGDYRIAFTCDADRDDADDGDPGTDDDDDANMTFTGETVVSIEAGETTTHNFQ